MGDQDGAPAPGTSPTSGGAPAGAPPAAPPPAPAAAPPPPATPPATPLPRVAQPQRHGRRHGKPNRKPDTQPFDTNPAVLKRIRQEGDRLLRKTFSDMGIQDLNEARALIEKGRKAGQPSTELAELQTKVGELERRLDKSKKKNKRLRTAKSLEIMTLEMRHEAVSSGIPDHYADVALDLYQRLWNAFETDASKVDPIIKAAFEKDPIDGKAVFGYIRAKHIPGAVAPEEVSLAPTTAPPESRAPGGGPPEVKPPNTPPEPFDASKLSPEEWRAHKRRMGLTL